MTVPENALPSGGPAKPAQNSIKIYETDRRDRLVLAGVLLWCFLCVDIIFWSWPWGMGLTAIVFAWYAVLAAALGQALFRSRESRVLFLCNLLLAAAFALGSNFYFRFWNLLALLVLIPIHACGLSGAAVFPWWRPAMLWARTQLFFSGLFGSLGAAFSTLTPTGKTRDSKRVTAAVLGGAAALLLLLFLVPVLASADALFAAATRNLRDFIRIHFTRSVWNLMGALLVTPFVFGLLYRLRRPAPAREKPAAKVLSADALVFLIILAALDGLYLLFLLVQSAGLFGGEVFLAQQGISYAEWARSGFFQMVGVTVLNLTVMLAASALSRRSGRTWIILRILSTLLAVESLVLLASALWRMSLYVSAYGLSFKRCMTYWGMAMMALFFLAALRKVWNADFSFCRVAFAAALAGWLLINCVPIDYLVARDQVDRYLTGESAAIDTDYLLYSLSYDTLTQLDRLDRSMVVTQWDSLRFSMGHLVDQRRESARDCCADWRTWNLSACLAAGSGG